MKKTLLSVAVVLSTSAFAQKIESKMGESYLPVADDWAIGVDATPFLQYVGNLIGGNGSNTAPTWNYLTTNQTITGKLFVEDQKAYRASLRLGFGSSKGTNLVDDRAFDVTTIEYPNVPITEVENTWKSSSTNVGISAGMEMRRGKGRLQGFYGAEIGIMLSSNKTTYAYGNGLTQTATGNVDVDAADAMLAGDNLVSDPFGNDARVLTAKSGMMFGVGLRAFIGAEFFVLPKLSIGGEFGWGLVYGTGGKASVEMESEGINGSGNEVSSSFTRESKNGSGFGIDTDAVNSVFGSVGSLRMTFHF